MRFRGQRSIALCSTFLPVFVVALVLVSVRPVDAQIARRTYADTLEVKVLNFEAVITDRDGQRAPELTKEDFTLYVDDERVPIEYFTEVREGAYVQTVDRYADQGVVAGKPSGTSFLVFVDEFFALDEDKKKVLQAIKQRVGQGEWSPLDRVAVVAWDGRGIDVISDWTGNRDTVLKAVDEAIGRPALGNHRRDEREQHGVVVDPADPDGASTGNRYRLDNRERLYAEMLASQLEGTVGAAAAAMRGLDLIPGRKALVLLSGGWPMNVDDWVGRSATRSIEESRVPSPADLYEPLAETANLLGYSIYGVDVPGRMTSGGSDGGTTSASIASFLEEELHATLRFLSSETGGLSLIDGDRITALGEVGRDVESFYWLGFTPGWSRNDTRRGIRVETARSDVEIRTRSGFLDAAPRTQVAMAVKSSLLFGMGRSSSELQMSLGAVEPAGNGLFFADIEILIPMSILTIRESESGYDAEASLFVAALDASGGRTEIPPTPLLLSSPVPFPKTGLVTHAVTLTLREDTERVAMALYDVYGGKTYTNTLTKQEEDAKN